MPIQIFYLATIPSASILSLLVLQNWSRSLTQNSPVWLQIVYLLNYQMPYIRIPDRLSITRFFTFISRNFNSLAKDDFQRVHLIETHNSIFNYDLISICETNLNDSITLADSPLNDYTFVPSNNPANTRHGGVGLFFKSFLPIKIRKDLSLNESIMLELNFGRKLFFIHGVV